MKRLRILLWVLFLPVSASAQSITAGVIAGVVKDATGAVLPGVTVEAASPSLIEKVRSVITDGQGNYKIIDLRPGSYTVTFTLTGFGTVKREGLELSAGFTATVNADMKVGTIAEAVTVTGASPVVDVQNVRAQSVLTKETLYSLPTSQTLTGFAVLTLGASLSTAGGQDVGGAKGEQSGVAGWIVHGGRAAEQRLQIDGMMFNHVSVGSGSATNSSTYVNRVSIAETVIVTGGGSAETDTGGVVINNVLKDGGNRFSGLLEGEGSGPKLQSDNLSSDLAARGITTAPKIKKQYDAGGAIGGPIRRNAVWFYTGHRWWGTYATRPGIFYNATPHTLFYTPDPSQPAWRKATHGSNDVRLTWQVTSKQKLAYFQQFQRTCKCGDSVVVTGMPDGSQGAHYPQTLVQSTWSYPRTNRLLFDAGATILLSEYNVFRWGGSLPTDIPVNDLTLGIHYGARGSMVTGNNNYTSPDWTPKHHQSNQRAAMSYVTGSHAVKVGLQLQEGWSKTAQDLNTIPGLGPVTVNMRNGAPVQIIEWRSPLGWRSRLMPNLGLYAQDQWTLRKLTLNLGFRYDYLRDYAPGDTLPAIPAFNIPERSFPANYDSTKWHDGSVRVGAAYDVFGNGKTAVKGYIGKYVQAAFLGDANAGASRISNSVTRNWTDANRNLVPDCVLSNPLTNGECGQISNLLFGQPIPSTTTDLTTLQGWGARPYSWQGSASFQQELRPGMAVNIGYFRTWYGNFTVTQNRAVTPSDYSQYCVTAPTDGRLGAASGSRICGLYDVSPAKFGRVDNYITFASAFGNQYETFSGVDVAMNARFGAGGLIQGGYSTGSTVTDNCAVITDSPQKQFCHVLRGWNAQGQAKVAASYPLPWYGLRISGTYQNLPPIPLAATNVFTNAQVVGSLGRNLASGAGGTVTVQLLEPNTMFEQGRTQQVDVRFSKIFRFGQTRLTASFDMYNAFNVNNVLEVTTAYGPNWLKPTQIMDGRLLKFGAILDF